jgi:hypothetical protein
MALREIGKRRGSGSIGAAHRLEAYATLLPALTRTRFKSLSKQY